MTELHSPITPGTPIHPDQTHRPGINANNESSGLHELNHLADRLSAAASALLQGTSAKIHHGYDALAQSSSAFSEDTRSIVRNKPLTCVAVAMAAGALLALGAHHYNHHDSQCK